MKPMRIYQCEDSIEGILTAVYEAGISHYGHDHIRLEAQSPEWIRNLDLFSEYIFVKSDTDKVEKVMRSIHQQIGPQILEYVLSATASKDEDKANVIYHYIVYGFAMGSKVADAMQIPWSQRMVEINRCIWNEVHHFMGFLRFIEVQKQPSVLLAVFEPENQILSMVTKHFADRLNPERFIIYDKRHGQASFHSPDGRWFLRFLLPAEIEQLEELERMQEDYSDLWKAFFEAICIKERGNASLQQNNIPLRYRGHMPEFR